jgi:hypothetical protein
MKICKITAKPNTWFIEGTEVRVACFKLSKDGGETYRRCTLNEINDMITECSIAVFQGMRKPEGEEELKLFGPEERLDEEVCNWSEFYFDIELSEKPN